MTSKRSVYMKTYLSLRISWKTGGIISFLWEIQHFQIYFHMPNTFLTLLSYERCVHVCIFSLYTFYLVLLSRQVSIAMWTILISKFWWWLLRPKRLTSTLHHNKFTYLDYVFFSAFFMHPIFDPYLLSYIYMYIQAFVYTHTNTHKHTHIWPSASCRIRLCRRVSRPPNKCPRYEAKQCNGVAPEMLEFWEWRCTPSL